MIKWRSYLLSHQKESVPHVRLLRLRSDVEDVLKLMGAVSPSTSENTYFVLSHSLLVDSADDIVLKFFKDLCWANVFFDSRFPKCLFTATSSLGSADTSAAADLNVCGPVLENVCFALRNVVVKRFYIASGSFDDNCILSSVVLFLRPAVFTSRQQYNTWATWRSACGEAGDTDNVCRSIVDSVLSCSKSFNNKKPYKLLLTKEVVKIELSALQKNYDFLIRNFAARKGMLNGNKSLWDFAQVT